MIPAKKDFSKLLQSQTPAAVFFTLIEEAVAKPQER